MKTSVAVRPRLVMFPAVQGVSGSADARTALARRVEELERRVEELTGGNQGLAGATAVDNLPAPSSPARPMQTIETLLRKIVD